MHLLIAAAGSGRRMDAGCNKLLLPLAGKPIIYWTIQAAIAAHSITWIGIVGQPIDKKSIMEAVEDCNKPLVWINGGSTRQESVQLGLSSLPSEAQYVLIHDGARCLIEADLLNQCAKKVSLGNAVIAATRVTDTIKIVDSSGYIQETPERSSLWAAQTPQGFAVDQLKQAHKKAIDLGWTVTDDASLYERLGLPVVVLESAPSNLKITTKFDLSIAESIILSKNK
ncbi:2-C-methyl-D-erythritol 4-phosphate cytidylyltransferase [Prochlorococcus sp. MIT 1223]|uniref:2-C-methyl-D-erythritol 4-phosphate cytidylyltransferase n=1 Tax=Prochlorococcus sp. MIT 1223 TaxID=3096217 RepID=UPI002A751FF8|nr:2-C-methyl-D-erythritol 4-phosphate cytidylyltransferase [Prochlorococcus sp. MIT 1223]